MTRVPKQPGWERRLVAWAEYTIGKPFVWGVTDCAQLVIQAIHAQTLSLNGGRLEWRVRRPAYRTRLGALRSSRESGGVRSVLLAHGLHEVPINYVQQGDIVVTPPTQGNPLEHAMVVVSGKLLDVRQVEGAAVKWSPLSEARVPGAVALRL